MAAWAIWVVSPRFKLVPMLVLVVFVWSTLNPINAAGAWGMPWA